ncbi:23S ribosomal RNA methyltransferase Erm [Alkalihalobacillus oceani]|uniref:23S ribosomal RNA methyltransferase Erm n=1 Tax=Halalkalibacter oceani TaxID=1653776 RepID=UPI00203E2617|nr:23S ribosomal RNA methyltransferase Erm [Halalkalibacter oceani]MCM3762910.1 23S ribosomal RNA methyltransferase Erm [Halalkalibacter oceani]
MTCNKYSKTKKINNQKEPNFPGQHFMHNRKLIEEIIAHATIASHETVLDLGAGKGALTTVLTSRAQRVLAVEFDQKLVDYLRRKMTPHPNVKVIHHDILTMPMPKQPFVVVSNIPYSITTPIMKRLLDHPAGPFQRGVIVMEKGAAKRFTSHFIKDAYVIAWRMFFDIRYVKDISRKNFSPPPKVDSALITIKRKKTPLIPPAKYLAFRGLADYALHKPGLPVNLALQGIFTPPQLKHLRRRLALKTETPISTLSEQQWALLFEAMLQHVPAFRWPKWKKRK